MFRVFLAALIFAAPLAIPPASRAADTPSAVLNGTVDDETGAPIAGADVELRGAAHYSTTTDVHGSFSIANIGQGIYALTVTKAGYETAQQSDIALLPGQTQSLSVRMGHVTFSSLRTIASVRSAGRTALNTSPASVDVVTTQTFVDQAQPQVNRVLDQIPGLQNSYPSNSTNGASPGSITVPNIRAATSYETASLIDGHPISVGQYGDNVTSFLNSFMFGNIEVVKGPGAESPVVNNAIGGTANFRTLDPTLAPSGGVLYGIDNHGGTFSNFNFSDTVGKLGFVVDFATNNTPSVLNGKQVAFDPSGGFVNSDGTNLNGNTGYAYVGNTKSNIANQFGLLACCYTMAGAFDQMAELIKFRYKFSSATNITVSYLDGQTTADQNANTSAFYYNSQFTPGPGYTGSLAPGAVPVANIYPGAYQGEINTEPIFQAEASTTIGKDSLLARFYHASIERYQFGGQSPNPDFNNVSLFGTNYDSNGNPIGTYNGTPSTVGFFDLYQEPEIDKLGGVSLEYQHPFGNNNLLTFSADRTISRSTDYSVYNGFPGYYYSYGIFPGTWQMLTTYLVRDHTYIGSKLEATISDYFNTYSSTYAVNCPGDCTSYDAVVNGTGVTFGTTKNSHNDPRLSLVYRATPDASVRLAAGSSIAPPFLGLLSQIASPPGYDSASGAALESQSNGNLRPETAFGWDLGADVRLHDHVSVISGDVYLTNLFNRFFGQTVATGLTCADVSCSNVPGNIAPSSVPVLNQTNINISNARFEGVELSLRHLPATGFGYQISGALQKGYYYNLPPYFYCSAGALQPGGCIPANYDQNMNVIAGQNTNGIPVGFYSISYNGNMRIPYSQADGELSYTFRNGAYLLFGDTYYGKNNSLNEPPFGIAYATIRYPVSQHVALQLSGDNIFNAYPGFLPVYGGGVPIPLADGNTAATTGNVLGPATYRFVLITKLP
jgi:outer membrane receptor protein involved in Fe transport